jgi:hypothetical protein
MFFNKLDETNTMVKSALAFEEVDQVSLADSGWFNTQKVVFFTQASNAMI